MVSLFILHMFMEAAAPSAASTVAASNESSWESGERRLATVAAGRKNGDPRASSCREWENPWDFLGKIMEILGDILISWGFMGFI